MLNRPVEALSAPGVRLPVCVGATACVPVVPGHAEPVSVTPVHVNDRDRMDGANGQAGAARIATVVREERARRGGRTSCNRHPWP